LIREGFRSIKTHGLMSFATVTIIMACLIIMGSVALVSVNISYLMKDIEKQNKIIAFVDDESEDYLTEEQALTLQPALQEIPNVTEVKFISRAEAMDNFMKNYDRDFMQGIDETVFRHRYEIKIQDIEKLAETKTALEDVPGIAKVRAPQEIANKFIKIRNIITGVALILMAILVFVSMFIMSNTIKLATFSRREEIAIMKMVGASNGFIRLPFVVEGLVLGLLGGGLGFLAQWGLYELVSQNFLDSVGSGVIKVVPFWPELGPFVLLIFLGIGFLIGVFGGVNAIRNYLKV
jgi:cell division transport system permease protein